MNNLLVKETKLFLNKSSLFILVVSVIDYLVLFIFNSLANNYITEFYNIKSILVVSVISGLLYVVTKD